MDAASLMAACAGSTYVVHLASPFFHSDDESVLIPPAVEGTKAIMEACKATGVRRCVITGSIACIWYQAKADKPANMTYNESYWSNPDRPEGMLAYPKSKLFAEKAAWEF